MSLFSTFHLLKSLFSLSRWRDSQLAMATHSAQLEEIRDAEERVKREMEDEAKQLRSKLETMMERVKELENELVLTESQFARAVAESEVSLSIMYKFW